MANSEHRGGITGFLRFLPGGALRLFGPSIVWLALRPVMLERMPEPQYGWLFFGIVCASIYWTIVHKRRFR